MTDRITIRLTSEQLRLLIDNFSQSFASEHEGNEDLDLITAILISAQLNFYRKTGVPF
jgi:hypothetical protein